MPSSRDSARFFDNAEEYRDCICGILEGGWAADIRANQDPDYFVLHRPIACIKVRTTEAGDWAPFVEGDFRKLVASRLSGLIAWGKSNGFSPDSFKCCGICAAHPRGQEDLFAALTEQFPESQIEEKSRLTEASPEDIRALKKLDCELGGEFFLEREWNNSRAIECYGKALEIDPEDAANYHNRARAYIRNREGDKALADCNQAISLMPEFVEAVTTRSRAYIQIGQNLDISEHDKAIELFGKAIEDCTQAIKLDPDNFKAYANRGYSYLRQREFDQAIEDLNQAIQLKPDSAMLYRHRGMAHADNKNIDQALEDYNQSIKLDPYSSYTFRQRAFIYQDKGELEKALEDLNKSMLNPDLLAVGYNNQAYIYENLGDRTKAQEYFEKAAALGHFDP